MSEQPDDAKRQVHRVWQQMAPGWERQRDFLRRSTRPLTDWLIRQLDPQPGQTILDLAAGPGELGFLVSPMIEPGGKLISTDFASEMVEVARRGAAEVGIENAEFRVIDAEQNDLPDDSVDGVMCRWGYMLMLDPGAALAETRRVLRPGGRLVFSVMGAPAQNPWGSTVLKTLVDLSLAPPTDPDMPGGLFSLADHDRLRERVRGAGFSSLELEEVDFRFAYTDMDDYWRFLTEFAGAVSSLLAGLTVDQIRASRQELEKRIEAYRQGAGYDFPGKSVNVLAT